MQLGSIIITLFQLYMIISCIFKLNYVLHSKVIFIHFYLFIMFIKKRVFLLKGDLDKV